MQADGLFVYGTLRTGGSAHSWLQRTDPVGQAAGYVPGRLFHLPEAGHPALVPGPEPAGPPPGTGWVAGEFVGYDDDLALESALADLDPLAGIELGRFERRILPVWLDASHHYQAWVYVFPEDRLPRLQREGLELPDGDWRPYL